MQAKQTDLQRLLSGTKVFTVPIFQRPYKWSQSQWAELFEDVLGQYNDPDVRSGTIKDGEGHFLGSIVLHPAPGPASTVAKYLIIDGQQRLITLLTFIAAIRDARAEQDPQWNPDQYENLYLSNPYNPENPYRLVPGIKDRESFVATLYREGAVGQIGAAYRWFSEQIGSLAREDGVDYPALERAVLLRLLVVEINTSSDDNVHHIFHTLNHSGMTLDAIDLIRNYALMQLTDEHASSLHSRAWLPVETALSERALKKYFWAQLVRTDRRATQRDLYGPFTRRIEQLAKSAGYVGAIEAELGRFLDELDLFQAIEDPTEAPASIVPTTGLRRTLQDLAEWGSSTYVPIALEVLARLRQQRASVHEADNALSSVLSFYVRRALCGVPTNNLNRILSAIPASLSDETPLDQQLVAALGADQKYWPSDHTVLERARSTAIYVTLQTRQVKLILATLERSLNPREVVSFDELSVEHVMPQTLDSLWEKYLQEHEVALEVALSRVHVLGNLTLTGYNSELGQQLLAGKILEFQNSNLAVNRLLAVEDTWLPDQIDARSQRLAAEAVRIWRRPDVRFVSPTRSPEKGMDLPQEFSVPGLIASLPATAWTTVDELAEATASTPDQVIALLRRSDPTLSARIGEVDGTMPAWLGSEGQREWVALHSEEAPEIQQSSATLSQQLIEFAQRIGDGAAQDAVDVAS